MRKALRDSVKPSQMFKGNQPAVKAEAVPGTDFSAKESFFPYARTSFSPCLVVLLVLKFQDTLPEGYCLLFTLAWSLLVEMFATHV